MRILQGMVFQLTVLGISDPNVIQEFDMGLEQARENLQALRAFCPLKMRAEGIGITSKFCTSVAHQEP